MLKILFIADVIGSPGREALHTLLPGLRRRHDVHLVICNAENSAAGFGLTRDVAHELFEAGVDVLTGGNHLWDKKGSLEYLAEEPRLVRPANLPPGVLHVYDQDGRGGGLGSQLPTGARVLERDSASAEITAPLFAAPGDLHIDKYRMSGFQDTELDSVLRNLRADTLLFAGVNADQCVLATLMDAASLGYDVLMLEDAVATTSPAYCMDATVYNVRQCFGFTLTAANLQEAL